MIPRRWRHRVSATRWREWWAAVVWIVHSWIRPAAGEARWEQEVQ